MSVCQVTWVIAALSSTRYIKESANQLEASRLTELHTLHE